MIIYSPAGETLLDVMPDDNSYRHRAIMGDNALTLYFSLAQHVEIPVGAYCEHGGEHYTLMRPEALKMQHTRHFDYTIELEGEQGKMSIWKIRNPIDGRLRFSLTARPKEHLQMLVDNLNRRDSGWTVGECIESAERVVNYDHAFCRDALALMAKAFDTEYEIVGKRISLGAVEHDRANALPLSYGKGNGFVSGVARTNSEDSVPTEILYVQGGERNIDRSKYGASTLHLPVNAAIAYDGAHFEGEAGYDTRKARRYRTDEKGFAVQRADRPLSSKAEDSVDLTDIYPSRVGTVGEVITANEKNHFYDFTDPTIPETLDFEKCLIAGEKMTVIFQSGMLSGREFEVKYAHAASGKKARRFEIVPQEIDGQTMPGGVFVPRSGDKYAVFHCMLPQAYINDTATRSGAEWDLLRKAVKHLYSHEDPKFSFTGTLDGIWAKRNWANVGGRLKIGAFIIFSDKQFQPEGVAVRIVGIKDYINTPHSPEIELSNAPVSSSFGTTLKALESAAVAVEEKHREALQYSKRRFRDAQETAEMIGAALSDRFTNAISPAAVQTMSLLVGDESLQFRFVGSRTNPTAVPHAVTYNAKTKTVNAASGILQHLTLGIRTVSAKHSPSEYRFWDVAAFTSGRLDDAARKYYLYVRAPRNGNRAEFVLKESPVGFESDAANYHLLVGVLNSEYDGDRSFAPLYGFSEVLPGRITTDRVATSDGRSFFDLAAGEMRLGDSLVYQNGRLSLRGTLVQNEGGVTSPLACYRGEWNATTTYYNGDEVRNTDAEGVVSTYRYIGERPSSGAPLTDKTKWTISASGVKGKDGDAGLSVGVNLLDGTNFNTGTPIYASPRNPKWPSVKGLVTVLPGGKNGANVVCAMGQVNVIRASIPSEKLVVGGTYVVSFWYRTNGQLWLWYRYPDNGHLERINSERPPHSSPTEYNNGALHNNEKWKLYTQEFVWLGQTPHCGIYVDLNDADSGKWIEICCLKVEEGAKPTTWCLSENDKIGAAGIDGESYHVNLIDNSSFAKGLEGWGGSYGRPTLDDSIQSPVPGTRVVKINGQAVGLRPYYEARQNVRERLLPNTTYTYSVWVKTNEEMSNARIIVYPAPHIEQQIDYEHGGEWTRHAITFTTGQNFAEGQYVFLRLCTQTNPNAAVWFAAPKLEVGDTSTEWTPSENDRKGEKGEPGNNGRGIERVESFYMLTAGNNTPNHNTADWTTTAPAPTKEHPWLWSYERTVYSDGKTDLTVVRLIGHYGKDGTNGTSIRAQYSADAQTWHDDFAEGDVWMRTGNGTTWGGALRVVGESGADGKSPVYDFAASSQLATASGTTAPTIRGTWQDAPPTLRDGEVLWYRLTAANGKITYGRLSGSTSYIHMAYANSDDGKKDFTLEEDLGRNAVEDFRYFGIYSDFDKIASQNYLDYTWTQLRGGDGLAPNPNLLDGTNFESRVPWATFNVSESAYSFNGKPTQFGMSQLAEGQFRDLLVQEITSVLKVGQTYTFSAWMQARGTLTWIFSGIEFSEAPKVNGVQTGNASGAGEFPPNKKSEAFERVTITFRVKRITANEQYFYIRSWGRSSANIVDPKLEVGAIDTPWCSSERDLRADYHELRFAVNGSPTQPPAISPDRRTPDGWNIAQPVVGVGQYLWMTSATVSRYETALLDRWSTPTRITPEDGKNGRDGAAPAMVYRDTWNASKEYYGTMHRRDAVFHNGAYYIARTDAGTFRGVDPTDKSKWNDFGASFESVATQLLLAEHASIGNWYLSQGRIISTLEGQNRIVLDAQRNNITLHTERGSNRSSDISLDADLGEISVKIHDENNRNFNSARISGDGFFANNAGVQCFPPSSGVQVYAAMCGYGTGELNDNFIGLTDFDDAAIVGVFGRATNNGNAPAYGGMFYQLKANGLILGVKKILYDKEYELDRTTPRVFGIASSSTVCLPKDAYEGQVFIITQLGSGTMLVKPPKEDNVKHAFRPEGNNEGKLFLRNGDTRRLTCLKGLRDSDGRNLNIWVID